MVRGIKGLTNREIEDKDFARLNELLKESFTDVRDDTLQLKEANNLNRQAFKTMHADIAALRKACVSTDKFNLVKIKVAELEDELPRLERAENAIRKLDEITIKKHILEKKVEAIKSFVKKEQEATKEDVQEIEENIQEDIETMYEDVADAKEQVKQELQTLAQEVNSEFAIIKRDLGSISSRGGRAVDQRLTAFKRQYTTITEDLKTAVRGYRAENASFVKKRQVENLIGDINQEFDELKKNTNFLAEQVTDLDKLSSENKKKVDKNIGLHQKVQTSHNNLLKLKEAMAKDVDSLKKQIKRIKEKLDMKTNNGNIKATKTAVLEEPKYKPAKKNVLTIISTVVIILAFVLLIIAAIIFLASKESQVITDGFIISAVIVFVLGIILRIIAAVRR